MQQTIETIEQFFNSDQHFQTLQRANKPVDFNSLISSDILGYLNPAHPFLIHFVGNSELSYLHSLNNIESEKLILQLIHNNARYIVFEHSAEIPATLLTQQMITILRAITDSDAFKYLSSKTEFIPLQKVSFHGSFVCVFGQGILITGDSGAGKSTLLLALLDRGHLWISDDAPLIYLNQQKQLIGETQGHLSSFIHVKSVGAINVDQSFGKAKRIRRHTLAAIIHLSNNVVGQHTTDNAIIAHKTTTILGNSIPEWCICKGAESKALLVESIARQLILNSWGDNATEALIQAHNFVTSAHVDETN